MSVPTVHAWAGVSSFGRGGAVCAVVFICLLLMGPATAAATLAPLGVYLGNGATGVDRLPAFSSWLGREPDRVLDFFAYDSWPSFESDALWTCASWRGRGTHPVIAAVTYSLPLTIRGTPLSEITAGRHDRSYLVVARAMVAQGWGGSIVRIGWEFNGNWMPWAAGTDPVGYIAAYRHVVALFRSVPGAHFSYDWCCAWGPTETPPDTVYPGDDVVDIIGMDVYARHYHQADAAMVHDWNTYLTARFGLNWLVSFAQTHRKPISIPEWGTGEWYVNDGGTGGGDDPQFVENMARFLAEQHPAYSDYWDFHAPDYDASVSNGAHPRAGAALRLRFGPDRRVDRPEPAVGRPMEDTSL